MKKPLLFLVIISFLTLPVSGQKKCDRVSPLKMQSVMDDVDALPVSEGQKDLYISHIEQAFIEQAGCVMSDDAFGVDQIQQADGELYMVITEEWDGASWVNDERNRYSHTAEGLAVSNTFQIWNGVDWENDFLSTFEYNDAGLPVVSVGQVWENQMWINNARLLRTFDENMLLLEFTRQEWENEEWVNESNTMYTYDNGVRTVSLQRSWVDSMWVNSTQTLTEFDDQGRIFSNASQFWDSASESWNEVIRTDYEYTDTSSVAVFSGDFLGIGIAEPIIRTLTFFDENDRETESIVQDYLNGTWVNDVRFVVEERNAIGLPTRNVDYAWDGVSWVPTNLFIDTYDSDSDLLTSLFQQWDGSTWVNAFLTTLSYGVITTGVADEAPVRSMDISIYPTPALHDVTIDFDLASPAARLNVEVFDLLGRRVAVLANRSSSAGLQRLQWSAESVPAGLYFVRIHVDGYSEAKSVVRL